MNRPDLSLEGELRHLAYATSDRLDVPQERRVAGSTPPAQRPPAVARAADGLRDLIAASPVRHLQIEAPRCPLREGLA